MKKRKTEAEKYYENMPPLQPIQIAQDGTIQDVEYQPGRPVTLANRLGNFGNTVADALLGKRAMPTDNIVLDGETMNATVSNTPRVGGILPDLTSGFRDNYNNRFNPQNFANEQLEDGRNKGFAYRLGEGLGTLGRFIDSPLGRGVLAYGLNNALGYGKSMQEGLTAAVGRQNAQTADRMYRQQLKRDYGYTDEDLSGITGNIDSTMFNNLTKSQYNAMNLAIRQQTAQSMNKLRELQAEKQRIINSTLPEMQKAKLLQENAKAEHAEEMQLARINYYNNAVTNPLGWANFGLKQNEYDLKLQKQQEEIAALRKLLGEDNPSGSGMVKIQAPDGSIREVPANQKDYYVKKGGKVL